MTNETKSFAERLKEQAAEAKKFDPDRIPAGLTGNVKFPPNFRIGAAKIGPES